MAGCVAKTVNGHSYIEHYGIKEESRAQRSNPIKVHEADYKFDYTITHAIRKCWNTSVVRHI